MQREAGRRHRKVGDDESSSEDEQQTTTTVEAPAAVTAPVAPARARAKAPAAAAVNPPTMPPPATHVDVTPPPAAAATTATPPASAAEGESSEESSEESEEEEEEEAAIPTAPVMDPAMQALANKLWSLDYDTLTYAALLDLIQQSSRPVVEELMAQKEQQVETTLQHQQGQRVERFLDVVTASPTAEPSGTAAANGEEAGTAVNMDGYRYNAMLTRIYDALNRNNEGSAMTERNQLPVPILERMGKKKTVIANFGRICEAFHRPMEDVKDFIEKELSIRGNLDSNDALILKFEIRKQTDFDRVLIKYLDEYVKCNSCHRIDTTLTKDGRRLELRCNVCTATRTVTAAGSATFSAQIEKRSRQRAAMTL